MPFQPMPSMQGTKSDAMRSESDYSRNCAKCQPGEAAMQGEKPPKVAITLWTELGDLTTKSPAFQPRPSVNCGRRLSRDVDGRGSMHITVLNVSEAQQGKKRLKYLKCCNCLQPEAKYLDSI